MMETKIPKTKNEAFAQLDAMLSEMDKKELVSRDAIEFYFTLGMWIRNNWIYEQEEEDVKCLAKAFRTEILFFLNLHSFGHSINDIDFCYFKNFFEECATKRELLFVSRCVQLRHVLQEVLIVREYHVVERMVVSHEDACVNLVEVCSLVCVLAHAIFRGHLSFARKPRHTAQGCHSA